MILGHGYYKVGKNEEKNDRSNLELGEFHLKYKHILHYFHSEAAEEAEMKVRRITKYSQPLYLLSSSQPWHLAECAWFKWPGTGQVRLACWGASGFPVGFRDHFDC